MYVPPKPPEPLRLFSHTYRKETFRGFYKGFVPYIIHVTPNICLVFLLYELMTSSYQEPSMAVKSEVAEVSDTV
jgi:hypothetical protein